MTSAVPSLQGPAVQSVRSETERVVKDITYDNAVLEDSGLVFFLVPFYVLATCMVSLDLVS